MAELPTAGEILLDSEFYDAGAVDEAVRAFAGICRVERRPASGGVRLRLRSGSERDLRALASYALEVSLRTRRRISSGSTNSGYSSDDA